MLIAKVQNGAVVDVADYRAMFPQTSFSDNGPQEEWMIENNCMSVTVFKPYDLATQRLEPCAPYIEGNTVYTVQVVDLPSQEVTIEVTSDETTLGQDTVPAA